MFAPRTGAAQAAAGRPRRNAMRPITLLSDEVEDYIAAHAPAEPALLAELRRQTHASLEYPQMLTGPVVAALLQLLIRVSHTRRIVEIGTFSGYSALCMAAALPADGELDTCDIDPKAHAVARSYFARSEHAGKIRAHLGPALAALAGFAAQGRRFDFAFIDADKEAYVEYYEAVLPMIEPGGLIVADNCLWSGRVLAPSRESDRGLARYNDHVHADPRVEHVLLSVRDGLMLARKRP
jgi:caffeoyl-CoA O-methyltransferase